METVKIQGNGYLVDGSISVPNDVNNRHYQEVQEWLKANIPEPEFTQVELDTIAIAESKIAILLALSQITITTTSGKVFDGDDIARADMMSAITASNTLGLTETNWKLADNTWALVQLDEMYEAHALAIQAKGNILNG